MAVEAMKQALEMLETIADDVFSPYDNELGEAILALRTAIEQAEKQEPVAWTSITEPYPPGDELDILMGDGSVLCGVLPQADGDLWWDGSGTGEKFIDPKYASVTHWRVHSDTTLPAAPVQEFVCSTGLCHYKAASDERLTVEDAVLAEREACAKVCDQFIDEMQKVLPVEKLRETDPYKAFYKANAARIIQDAIRARGNT